MEQPVVPPGVADAAHSRFVQRVRRRYGQELPLLGDGVPTEATLLATVAALRQRGHELGAALRIARQLVLERLAVLDVERQAPLSVVTQAMTMLAEVSLELALEAALAEADARHGAPLDAHLKRCDFWIVGMGKLGARELNVSSDIDLVYLYEDDGQTAGPRPVSFHEYFSAIARRLQVLVGDTTEHGFVFRMDLALRPNGNSGPPVASLAMFEEYLQIQGREWERLAWLKSRVVAPRAAVTSGRALALRSLVTPFVYRRYLDYGVFEGLRQIHRKIRDEAQRRAAGRPERANDVKLSRGGIREIEFIVQLLLVVRGGQFPEIRTRSTLKALARLAGAGLMKPAVAESLANGYTLLRRIEHRIQFLDDQQTHLLPTADADLAWIAASLHAAGAAPDAAWGTCELLARLGEARELVAAEFDALLLEGQGLRLGNGSAAGATDGIAPCRACGTGVPTLDSEALLASLPPALAERVRPWAQSPRVLALRDESRQRLGRLVKKTAQAVADGICTEQAAVRFIDWVEPLLRRESYLALLVERPEVQRRLLRLLGLARWPMQYLMRHPGVIDELADERLLHQRFDAAAFRRDLTEREAAWQRSGEASDEQLLDTLRRAHHAEVFRTLVRDVEGELSVEQVADELSALADAVLATAIAWCWARLKQRHREVPQIAVIAYGKLGGKELGYGSDLDLVFLYDDSDEDDPAAAQNTYGLFVRKLLPWLTLRTAAGELFDIDTALRPNGNSGLLVTSVRSFEAYQGGRGSNTAWTWEHQALTRARFATGAAHLAARFEATRRAVLTARRDVPALMSEVLAMRDKLAAARPVPAGRYDVKHSPGGMVDVEFCVQALVLAHGHDHAALLENAGNIALLQRAEDAGLLPSGVGHAAADAYRDLRRAQHRARLDEAPTQFDPVSLAEPREAVLGLVRAVFAGRRPDPAVAASSGVARP
ncbi:MAG: bifunctional [glutamate--ammonia ligase]-adenylyl-L-tyrosine phosphorylase/[glutamate--ammonia-ligase] adenylyltransferase [Rubrivivax sp.]|nr:bifunctional [glutamate--ammonia ligase]-adenylyl-L-tyrosine phosphorylase/[glutamate--ammonia-ligase] adenylyltransferase [Rubrivivax sp.]